MGKVENHMVGTLTTGAKIGAYIELLKPRLSFLVAFSSGFGYILASNGQLNWANLLLLSFGGMLVSGASVTINQIIEIEYDALMKRTKNRPLPTGKISKQDAAIFSALVAIVGLYILYLSTNPLTVVLSFVSLILYSFVYTPMKRVGPIAVFIGAIPGALPPLLGWVAATGVISFEALIIFGIQFIWQFPHFWAIAWVGDEDYKKAGFKLLPNNGRKDLNTAINIMIYTLFLLPLGLLPTYFGVTGLNSAVVVTICGCGFLAQTFSLMRDNSDKAALKIMFGSFLYLPIVQIAYMLDKI
ncbi:protoheme IX farnesyltransferase [Reichenbachiella faecimaris]|uniref:Protoheme IX farnesyltransferase n=1 Tax=Reichenbachiella faecimaris TaxID=692418 RepID=A0A1W2G9J5_REIFA|nr:heme o synthase [Reichenbachiella faecimaris]SMD33142.1 protoheme IX farnesyltransferase [Reichenbachiella faecimaris]